MEVPLIQPAYYNSNPSHGYQQNYHNPDNYQDDPNLQNDPNETPRIDADFAFGHSHLSNMATFKLYAVKIAYSIFILVTSKSTCLSFAFYWVIGMLIHDIMAIFIPIKRMKNSAALKRINENPSRPEDLNPDNIRNNLINQDLEALNLEQRLQAQREIHNRLEDELAAYRDTLYILKTTRSLQKLSDTSLCFWMILVFGGVYFKAFRVQETCVNPDMNDQMNLYLLLGVAWLFRHVLVVILGCVCLPVILIVVWLYGNGQKKASNAVIKKLPVKPYKSDFPGEKECPICMVEYEEGEKVVMLACNSMHYFHEECGKKWLKINGQCPICRARVDGKKDEPNNNNN